MTYQDRRRGRRFTGMRAAVAGWSLLPLLLASVIGCGSSASKHFPHAFPNSLMNVDTNVSSTQAFNANHIVIPPEAMGLEYDANNESGYIVDATFSIPCNRISGFIRANMLSEERGSREQTDLTGSFVMNFAQKLGWKSSDSLAHAYHLHGNSGLLEAIITGRGTCQVYLSLDGNSQ